MMEALDSYTYLEDYLASIEGLASEIQHVLEEVRDRDNEFQVRRQQIHTDANSLKKMIKLTSFDAPSAEETATIEKVQDKFKEAEVFADQKMAWTERGCLLIDKALKRLDNALAVIDTNYANEGTVSSSMGGGTSSAFLGSESTPKVSFSDAPFLPTPSPDRRNKLGLSSSFTSASSSSFIKPPRPPPEFSSPPPSLKKRKSSSLNPLVGHIHSNGTRSHETPETDDQIYCFCRQPSFGGMVACDAKDCPYEWFHFKCVGLSDTPKGVWYCPDCRMRRLTKSKLYMSTTAEDEDGSSG